MSTVFTHPAIPLAIGLGINAGLLSSKSRSSTVPFRLLLLGCLFSVLPDLDVIGFELGVSYWSSYGHRGFTHSIFFAIVCGLTMMHWSQWLGASKKTVFLFLSISMMSHGFLDSMTYGGLGVAFFWPFDTTGEFMQWRPLPVSPIGIDRFFNRWGAYVIKTEFRLIWIPAMAVVIVATFAGWLFAVIRKFRKTRSSQSGPH